MKRFLLVLIVLIGVAHAAQAAAIFNRPNKDNVLPDAPTTAAPQEQAPAAQQTPSAEAPAEKPVSSLTIEEFSKNYYDNCLKQKHPIMKGEPLRMLCDCTADKVKEKMTIEEVVTMTTDTAAGQAQRNRMAVHVYAPCMEYPTRALLYHNCKTNKDVIAQHATNGEALCTCMADDMAAYIAKNGPGVMAQRLMANPNDMDPLSGFLASPEFQTLTQNSFMGCVGKLGVMPKKGQ